MRADLFTHPKVVRMSSALKADTLRTVGGLMSVWCLFDAHSEDGLLDGYSPEVLDAHLRWDGFSQAMMSVGWLTSDHSQGLLLPRFDTHNGQSAKRRAQDTNRKREARNTSAPDADKKRTREEKRREEKSSTDVEEKRSRSSRPVTRPEGLTDSVWQDFLAIRKAKRSPLTQTALDGIAREASKAGMSLQQALEVCCARGWQGFKADWMAKDATTSRTQGPGETQYQRSMRERAAAFAPLAARQAPADQADPFFDLELVDVIPATLPALATA